MRANLVLSLALIMGLSGLLLFCDNRMPSEFERPPLLELTPTDSVVTYFETMDPDTIIAVLLNADRGTVDGNATIHFSAQKGHVTGLATTTDGQAKAFYYAPPPAAPFIDTVRAYFAYNGNSDTVFSYCTIRVLPGVTSTSDSVGSVELFTSNPAVAVKTSGGNEQAFIIARVKDVFGNLIKDGTRVTFQILSGTGGGENLNNKGSEDTASTTGGYASVTYNSGTKVGVVEILATCKGKTVQARLLTVTAGPPARIDIDANENSVVKDGSRWRMYINATLTDLYYNPVKAYTSVIFSFDTSYTFLRRGTVTSPLFNKMAIQNSALTEVRICPTCDSIAGTAVTWMNYATTVIYDSVRVRAETKVNGVTVAGSAILTLPIPVSDIKVTVTVREVPLRIPSSWTKDTAIVDALLSDGYNPIVGGTLCIATDMGRILNMGQVQGECGVTDTTGIVRFRIEFVKTDQVDENTFTQTNNVSITEPTRQFNGKGSFTVIFQ